MVSRPTRPQIFVDLRTRPVHLRPPRGSRKVPDATRQHWPQGSLLVFGFLAGRPKLICLYCKLIIDSNCIYDIYIIIVVYYNIIHIISNIIFYNTYMIIHVWPWDGMGFTTILHRPRMNCQSLHCQTEHLLSLVVSTSFTSENEDVRIGWEIKLKPAARNC